MILSFYRSKSHSFKNPKKTGFPWSFSQLPETRVLKFCPELETLSTWLRNCMRVKQTFAQCKMFLEGILIMGVGGKGQGGGLGPSEFCNLVFLLNFKARKVVFLVLSG